MVEHFVTSLGFAIEMACFFLCVLPILLIFTIFLIFHTFFSAMVEHLLLKGADVSTLCRVPGDAGLVARNNFVTPLGFAIDMACVESVYILLDNQDPEWICEKR